MEVTGRTRKIMEKYGIEPRDIIFAEAQFNGWGDHEAAYYAYGLSYPDKTRIKTFIQQQNRLRPGIAQYLAELEDKQRKLELSLKEYKAKADRRQSKEEKKAAEQQEITAEALRTKQGTLDYLIDIASTPGLDPKMKVDLAKQITDLQQYKKEEIKEEDDHIHFHLPINCKYCDRCVNCELKKELDKLGYPISKVCQSPLIWKIAGPPAPPMASPSIE